MTHSSPSAVRYRWIPHPQGPASCTKRNRRFGPRRAFTTFASASTSPAMRPSWRTSPPRPSSAIEMSIDSLWTSIPTNMLRFAMACLLGCVALRDAFISSA